MSIPAMSQCLGSERQMDTRGQRGVTGTVSVLKCHPGPVTHTLIGSRAGTVTILSAGAALCNRSRYVRKVRRGTQLTNCSLAVNVLTSSDEGGLESDIQSYLSRGPTNIVLLGFSRINGSTFTCLPPRLPIIVVTNSQRRRVTRVSLYRQRDNCRIAGCLLSLKRGAMCRITVPKNNNNCAQLGK